MEGCSRRTFIGTLFKAIVAITAAVTLKFPLLRKRSVAEAREELRRKYPDYNPADHYYKFIVDTQKCTGCGKCVEACQKENAVPGNKVRTWVERIIIRKDGKVVVDSPDSGINGFPPSEHDAEAAKAFFVPKLCNHCEHSPCIQVCPVGATFLTEDGVVLIDPEHCIGCGYCVQACPYGTRFINPGVHTADKCTWCYHRITKGLLPACVEICPEEARIFIDIKQGKDSRAYHTLETTRLDVLKPELATEPKVYYVGLDKEVR